MGEAFGLSSPPEVVGKETGAAELGWAQPWRENFPSIGEA